MPPELPERPERATAAEGPAGPDARALREPLIETLRLKEIPRTGWLRAGVDGPESVAAHCWGVSWLVLALCPDELDLGRALAIAVLHDLAEIDVGDLAPGDLVPRAEKLRREGEALARILAPFPRAAALVGLWRDYAAGNSAEARLVKACDRLDMALQATRYRRLGGLDAGEFLRSALRGLPPGPLRMLAVEATGGELEE